MDIKKKKEKKPSGKNISSVVQLKNGSFSLAVTAIVLAIIVVVNLIIGQLPSKLLNWDLSETGIFSVSDTSKELLKDLDKDVTVEDIDGKRIVAIRVPRAQRSRDGKYRFSY